MCFDNNLLTSSSSQTHLVFPPTFSSNHVFFFLFFPSRPIWYGGLPWDHGWLIQGYTVRENRLVVFWELWTANTRHKQVAGGHFGSNPSLHAGIWSGSVYRDLGHYVPTSDRRSWPNFKVGARIWKAGLVLLQSQQFEGEGRRILSSRLSWAA